MTAERNAVTPEFTPLKRAFLALEEARARIAALESGQREPIAIIGVGCRVPGADGPAAFWRLLESGTDATGDVPADRWDADAYYDADPEAEGRITSRRGGFLRDVDRFDAEFFGIAPREARGLDPQQRLLLEVSWEALEHAGIAADRLEGSSTGVYIGMAASDYGNAQIKSADPALLKLALVSLAEHLRGDNGGSPVQLSVYPGAATVKLRLSPAGTGPTPAPANAADPRLLLARRLLQQQGGSVTQETENGRTWTIVALKPA